MADSIDKLYITITTKPLSIAAREKARMVGATITVAELTEAELLALFQEAVKRLQEQQDV